MLLKILIISVVLYACVQNTDARVPPEIIAAFPSNIWDMIMTLRGICSKKFNLTIDDIDNFVMSENVPQPFKCYMSCMIAAPGWMNEEGNIDFDRMISSTPPKLRNILMGMVNKCRHIIAGELCETAYKFQYCTYKADPKSYFLI